MSGLNGHRPAFNPHPGAPAEARPVPPPTPFAADPVASAPTPPASAPALAPVSAPPRDQGPNRALVAQLTRQVADGLADWRADHEKPTAEEVARERDRLIVSVCDAWIKVQAQAGRVTLPVHRQALLAAVTAEHMGLGSLQPLLVPEIEEVHAIGCDQVRITYTDGRIGPGAPIADSDTAMLELFAVAARRLGSNERSLSPASPFLSMAMPDGSRLSVVAHVADRPHMALRRHNTLAVSLADLAEGRKYAQVIDSVLLDFLTAAIRARLNIMVAGVPGAGKSTLLRALAAAFPAQEPFLTLEETRELYLHTSGTHPWAMSWETRQGHGEPGPGGRPIGEVTLDDMVAWSLRMSVQRIIVGEVRGREIVPMLESMDVSQGSLCTIHARDVSLVGDRIIELALKFGHDMTPELATRMAAGALDLIVYVTLDDESVVGGHKHRYVSHVQSVDAVRDGHLVTTDLFAPGPDGRARASHLPPPALARRLLRVGYDPTTLDTARKSGTDTWKPVTQVLDGRTL